MIYLDNSATTPIDPEVLDAMMPYLKEEFGNPSSRHYTLAKNAERAVEEARENLASLINSKPDELIFTSGASESNNFVIKGVADYKKYYENSGNHIITSKVEHKSILQTCKFLSGEVYLNKEKNKPKSYVPRKVKSVKVDRGYDVTFLDVNEYGQVENKSLDEAIKDTTILVSIMWGNNEVGSLNDIKSLSSLTREKNIRFHSDATQVLGKIHIDVKQVPVDFLSFSAHKIYGPKGIGACYIRNKMKDTPNIDMTALIHGGLQEGGYRAGTHAVHNIVGFGKAAEIAKREMKEYNSKIIELELETRKLLKAKFPNVEFLGDPKNHIPGVIPVILPEIINEMLIEKLSNDVAISSGSACSIGEPSYVIEAIGKKIFSNNFIRISLNAEISSKEICNIIDLL
ncbi:cysteine desulfurase family protein [Clostridium sp. A1-XYC3]|uniref:cysteine desulfurase n=1 Tax=Clostridium tanneri TaxID=3037988 RepID=A0ABU4JTI2_9CLOT|nr:cysteine desulfurase family protein [Clostridium sp. A1-XYC3]MDW8801463.1 cysteine desulfurase family protein [Clostridium sp. A1-XYC3]